MERMPVLLLKQRVIVFEPLFVGVRGNVCDSSLASWKAGCRLPIGYNCTFFVSFYGLGTNASKSDFIEGVGHFGAKY